MAMPRILGTVSIVVCALCVMAAHVDAKVYHVRIETLSWQGKQGYFVFDLTSSRSQYDFTDTHNFEVADQSDPLLIANVTHDGGTGMVATRGGSVEGDLMWL